jgi:myo-inositol 2-dehydrogenase/D-chiro-inositol 1-dehydrogenase
MTWLRIGVIGTGIMGADHAGILARFVSGAELRRVTDADVVRARGVADATGAGVSRDALSLIADPDVDGVVIASSDATHAELVLACARAGKPVLCEKPLAPTLDEAANVVRTLESSGQSSLLSLGFMRRFDPAYVELKHALDEGACGAALLVHCVSRGVTSGPGATSASSVTGSAIHELDTVPWLLGSDITSVAWLAPRCSAEVEGLQDPQVILLRTADGALTTVETFLNAGYGYDIRCEVVGERGALALTDQARTVRDANLARGTTYAADWRPRFADAYRLELQAWVDAVRTGTPTPLATAHDGLVASAVADAVLRSMEAGGTWVDVAVPDVGQQAESAAEPDAESGSES